MRIVAGGRVRVKSSEAKLLVFRAGQHQIAAAVLRAARFIFFFQKGILHLLRKERRTDGTGKLKFEVNFAVSKVMHNVENK